MKILKIFLILCSIFLFLNGDDDYKKYKHSYKNLDYLNLDEKDENSIRTFVVVLSLIAQASAIKKLVQKIVNEYHS